MPEPFDDVMAANDRYAEGFRLAGLAGRAAKGLLVLTCMDTRLEPLPMLGLAAGDAKVLRNAGGRVTDEVLQTLALSAYLLDVRRVMVVEHTKCRMASGTAADIHAAIRDAGGPDTRSIAFVTTDDQETALRGDVERVRAWPYAPDLAVGGFLYDVDTGRLRQVC